MLRRADVTPFRRRLLDPGFGTADLVLTAPAGLTAGAASY